MIYFLAAIAGVFGLAVGSFLNVVIYRVPIGRSIVSPASACPNCGSGIHAYDNVPVLSWLALRGKCRSCSEPISARYPLVELGTGLFFFIVSVPIASQIVAIQPTVDMISSTLVLAAYLYLAAISVALAFIDVEHHRLPNAIVLPAYGVGVVLLGAGRRAGRGLCEPAARGDRDGGDGRRVLSHRDLVEGRHGTRRREARRRTRPVPGLERLGCSHHRLAARVLPGRNFRCRSHCTAPEQPQVGNSFGPWMVVGAWVGVLFGNQLWSGYLAFFGLSA